MFDDNLIERFELASERIKEIKTAGGACSDGRFSDYFCKMSEFIISMTELFGKVKNNEFEDYTFNQLSEFNKSLYEDILEKNYDKSCRYVAWLDRCGCSISVLRNVCICI